MPPNNAVDDPPKYRKIEASLRELIISGEIAPGAAVPSITDLTRDWNCARLTAAKALRTLAAEGLVAMFPGVGVLRQVPRPTAGSSTRQSPSASSCRAHGGQRRYDGTPPRPGTCLSTAR